MKQLIIFILFTYCIGCNNTSTNKVGLDTTTNIYWVSEKDDYVMNQAIEKASKTIDYFDNALKIKNINYTDFAIKKRFKTKDDGGEYIWITVISIVSEGYKGIINNDAEVTKEVKYGDTVIVNKNEISDWMYLDNNVLKGGYTIRVIREKLNKTEREKMDEDLGFKIED